MSRAASTGFTARMASRGPFYGWWILLTLCVLIFYVAGTVWWGSSVFFAEILEEFGWSRAKGSVAFTLQSAESAGLAAVVGLIIDRIGARRLLTVGIVISCLGFLLLRRTNSLWWFYGAYFLLAMGSSGGIWIVSHTLLVRWFYRRRARAVTVLSLVPGLGAMLIVPVLNVLIQGLGWRDTMVIAAFAISVLVLPVLMVVRDWPESVGLYPDGAAAPPGTGVVEGSSAAGAQDERSFTVREVLRMRTFWLLATAFAFWNVAHGVQPHLFVALVGSMSPQKAAFLIALVAGLGLVGRFGFGFFFDFVDKRHLLSFCAATTAVGLGFLAALVVAYSRAPWLAIPFVGFFAIGLGGTFPLRVLIISGYFGRQHFGPVFAALMAVSAWGSLIGPVFVGWAFDATDSYFTAFATCSVLFLLSVPLCLMATNPQLARPPSPSSSPAKEGEG